MLVGITNILAVGTRNKQNLLEQLPVRVVIVDRAKEAIACLKKHKFSSLISQWHLEDMANGEFLGRFINARPGVPTVAFIEPHNAEQEIAARSLGVSLVLPDDVEPDQFQESLCTLLNLSRIENVYEDCPQREFLFNEVEHAAAV